MILVYCLFCVVGSVSRETNSFITISMNKQFILDNLRNIPDYPKPGIQFQDVSTVFKNTECLSMLSDELYKLYKDKGITKVVGIESRGFVLGAIIAARLGAGFVMCRKPGKLPGMTRKASYQKEYGYDCVEIHDDAIDTNDVVLIHDDLLATGGSMLAACQLVRSFSPKEVFVNFILELQMEGLKGREALKNENVTALLEVKR